MWTQIKDLVYKVTICCIYRSTVPNLFHLLHLLYCYLTYPNLYHHPIIVPALKIITMKEVSLQNVFASNQHLYLRKVLLRVIPCQVVQFYEYAPPHLFWSCCNLAEECILALNGQVQNISYIPAIIFKLHAPYSYPRSIGNAIESLRDFIYYSPFSTNIHKYSIYLLKDFKNYIIFCLIRTVLSYSKS